MVKLTDAIIKAQQGTATSTARANSIGRQRSTSQNNSRQDATVNSSSSATKQGSKKQAPICVTGDKLSLNYQEITSLQIDRQGLALTQQSALAFQFAKVKKLFLSHNNLASLDGIENFANLTHLSISHNKLISIDELSKIGAQSALHGAGNNAGKLQCLAVKGNFFLERHPDYKALVIRHFTGLRELDSQPLNPGGPNQLSLRGQVREGTNLKHLLVPFLLKLDRSLQFLTAHLDGTVGSKVDRIELVQKWTQIFNQKDFLQRGKISQRNVTAQSLRQFIKTVDTTLNSAAQVEPLKVRRQELYDLFQWLYQELILKLSTELRSTDLVKFLNYKILQKFPLLADFLNVKNQVDPTKQLDSMDQRQIERLCTLLERDQQISLEMLLAEQLNAFYELQPELSTIQDMSSEIAGIEIIEEPAQQQNQNSNEDGSSLPNRTMNSETRQMITQIASAVQLARGMTNMNSRTSSPNTFSGTRRMVVENSGGSALDHPVILQNQRELIERSLKTHGSTVDEAEFSFRERQERQNNDNRVGLQNFSPPQDHNLNEQSFLVNDQRAKTEHSGAKDKHSESPVRRQDKPIMKSFFKIKQTADTEILPNRGDPSQESPSANTSNLQIAPQRPDSTSLKMNIPKNYFNQEQQLGVNETAEKSSLGPDPLQNNGRTRNDISQVSDSFQLSGSDPILAARGQFQAQPQQQVAQDASKRIIARFLEDECDEAALRETRSYLKDKVMAQFPIFALNEDYMRALALIIMNKIERAQALIEQLGTQIFKPQEQEDQKHAMNESDLQSSSASGAQKKKKLTDAEREKLSLIKRKLQEKKLQSALNQERNSTRSRSVSFNEQCISKSRSRSRGVASSNSKDSCFSPVQRRRQSQNRRSRSGSLIRQQQQAAANASQISDAQQRVYASGILREQSQEHQRLTDEQNAQLWVKKKQARQLFIQRIKRICVKFDMVEERTKQQALYQWIRFAQRLHILEHQLRSKHSAIHKQKALYFWMAAYQQSAELTRGLHRLQIKQKVWYQLVINRKQAQLSRAKVDTYYRQKLLLKSFYGFLKILEKHREQQRKEAAEEKQKLKDADEKKRLIDAELQRKLKKRQKKQKSAERKELLQSPPISETAANKYKRTASKSSRGKQSPEKRNSSGGRGGGGLGLINVNPIIDKQIDGVYDLDIVDVQRQSYEDGSLRQDQPLLNAVRSQQVINNNNDMEECHDTFENQHQHVNSMTFSDNLINTNALLNGQRTVTSNQGHVPSAYFNKQVNFFKTGGGNASRSFVQARGGTNLRRSQSREETRMNKQSSHSGTRNNNRSNSKEHSLNHSKRSILKKVYGGGSGQEFELKKPQLKWSIQQQTQTDPMSFNNDLMTDASAQADFSLNHSFGKLMAERSKRNNETSSCLDLQIANKTATSGQSSAEKQKIKGSRKKLSRSRDGKNRITATLEDSTLGHSRTEQNSLMTFRPSKVYTTQAKARQRTTRGSSKSQEGRMRSNRMNCGNLSKSIQDHEPKGYEKATVSFVSKHLMPPGQSKPADSAAQQNSQMFKHLKNATMAGSNGDIFKATPSTSASNKKLYQKLLVK